MHPRSSPPICLIRPRAGEAFRFSAQSISLPLGLAYIAGALEASGRTVHVVDAVGEAPRTHTRYFRGYLIGLPDQAIVERIPPDSRIVGISVIFTHEWPAIVKLIDEIKRARPEATIVLGGEHVTAMPEFCLATSPADVLVLGEGEETIVEVVDALESAGGSLDAVAGIAFRKGGRVFLHARRERRLDIDRIARPAWHHFRVPTYHRNGYVGGVYSSRITVPILATRGCPYQCTYCTNPNMWTTRWVAREPAQVVDEIQDHVATYGASNFPFQDLTAIIRKDWIVAFAREVIRRGLDITWQLPTGTRSEAIDEEVAELLKRSGMIGMAYAPESGSERTRELIKKEMHTSRLFASIEAAVNARLNVAVFLIVGFPHDTREQLAENLPFVDRLVAAGITDLVLGYYMNLPGTELFDSQYDAGKVRLDRTYFGHILQSTELFPSISYCEHLGRLGLAWWKYRLYLRFFAGSWRKTLGGRQLRSARRALSGLWNRETDSKLPAAIRHSLKTLWNTIKVRFARRWIPRREERRLIAGWDAIYREIRAQQLASVSRPTPATQELFQHNVNVAIHERHATTRVAVLSWTSANQSSRAS